MLTFNNEINTHVAWQASTEAVNNFTNVYVLLNTCTVISLCVSMQYREFISITVAIMLEYCIETPSESSGLNEVFFSMC